MSYTEHLKGKLELVDEVTDPDETEENMFYRFLVGKGFEFDQEDLKDPWDGMYKEMFEDEFYREFVCIDSKIYKVIELVNYDNEDFAEAKENDDGTISFNLRYYNGGAGFEEVLEWAFEDMEERKGNGKLT